MYFSGDSFQPPFSFILENQRNKEKTLHRPTGCCNLRSSRMAVLSERFEKLHQPKADILVSRVHGAVTIPRWMSIVFVPIAHDSTLRERDELRIRTNELCISRCVETAQVVVDDLKDFDYIFADKLNDKRRDPDVRRIDDSLEMALANITVVMPRQETVDKLSLQSAQALRVDERRAVVDAAGY